jgi:hypothetical protein
MKKIKEYPKANMIKELPKRTKTIKVDKRTSWRPILL